MPFLYNKSINIEIEIFFVFNFVLWYFINYDVFWMIYQTICDQLDPQSAISLVDSKKAMKYQKKVL